MTPSVPETLAALEHEQWAHWTKHLLDTLCDRYALPADDPEIRRWRQQIQTPYLDLSEHSKASDRVWAQKALTAVAEPLETTLILEYRECCRCLADPTIANPLWWLGYRCAIETLVARLAEMGIMIMLDPPAPRRAP